MPEWLRDQPIESEPHKENSESDASLNTFPSKLIYSRSESIFTAWEATRPARF